MNSPTIIYLLLLVCLCVSELPSAFAPVGPVLSDNNELLIHEPVDTEEERTRPKGQPPQHVLRFMDTSNGIVIDYNASYDHAVRRAPQLQGTQELMDELGMDLFNDFEYPGEEALEQLDRLGYYRFRRALRPDHVDLLHQLAMEAARVDYLNLQKTDHNYRSGDRPTNGNHRIHGLRHQYPQYKELENHPVIEWVMQNYLGWDYMLDAHTAYVLYPTQEKPVLHQDAGISAYEKGKRNKWGATAIYCMDDWTAENGATSLIPGSHKWEEGIPVNNSYPGEIQIEAEKGDIIFIDAALFHGTAKNNSPRSRRPRIALVIGFVSNVFAPLSWTHWFPIWR